jgi:hypothetical protein
MLRLVARMASAIISTIRLTQDSPTARGRRIKKIMANINLKGPAPRIFAVRLFTMSLS